MNFLLRSIQYHCLFLQHLILLVSLFLVFEEHFEKVLLVPRNGHRLFKLHKDMSTAELGRHAPRTEADKGVRGQTVRVDRALVYRVNRLYKS